MSTVVLVVEDDDAIRTNIARLLKLEGFTVNVAVDGVAGLQRARELRPHLVISDVNMPGMDGFALVEALRADAALATTPVLMLTALDDRGSMRRGMAAGADDYLAKPFTRLELLEAIDGLLKKRGRIELTIHSAVQAREERLPARSRSAALATARCARSRRSATRSTPRRGCRDRARNWAGRWWPATACCGRRARACRPAA
jgi:DNA-binding response OmpR family regulator